MRPVATLSLQQILVLGLVLLFREIRRQQNVCKHGQDDIWGVLARVSLVVPSVRAFYSRVR